MAAEIGFCIGAQVCVCVWCKWCNTQQLELGLMLRRCAGQPWQQLHVREGPRWPRLRLLCPCPA